MSDNTIQQQSDAWSQVQLMEKTIEPDNKIAPEQANRNMQLGNIDPREIPFVVHRHERAMDLLNFPEDRNGWMYNKYGIDALRKNDAVFLISGSKDGFVRQLMRTSTQVQRMKDETDRGMFGSIMGKRQ